MAKKTKKKRKTNKMPPLYWVDKLIYWVLIAMLVVICAFVIFYPLFAAESLYFYEEEVVAFDRHASVLWILPTFFLFFMIIVAVGSAYSTRRPIFGIPNFRYGPSQYGRFHSARHSASRNRGFSLQRRCQGGTYALGLSSHHVRL